MKKTIVVLLSLIMVLMLVSCGKTESPSEVTNRFFKALQEKDSKTIDELYEGDDIDLSNVGGDLTDPEDDESGLSKETREQLLKMIFDFDYEVGDEEIKDDEATVKVKTTSYALGDMMGSIYTDLITWALENMFDTPSDEETQKKTEEVFAEKMEATEKSYTKDIEIKLIKKDDKWIVSKDNESEMLLNAISGDLGEKIKELEEASDD